MLGLLNAVVFAPYVCLAAWTSGSPLRGWVYWPAWTVWMLMSVWGVAIGVLGLVFSSRFPDVEKRAQARRRAVESFVIASVSIPLLILGSLAWASAATLGPSFVGRVRYSAGWIGWRFLEATAAVLAISGGFLHSSALCLSALAAMVLSRVIREPLLSAARRKPSADDYLTAEQAKCASGGG